MYYFVDTWPTPLSHRVPRSTCYRRLLTSSPLLLSLLFSLFQVSKNIIFNVLQPAYIILLYLL